MKKIIITLVFVIAVSCQTQDKNKNNINEINQWIANYEEAVKSADVKTLLDGMSDAIVYYPPNQPAITGKENLKKWFSDYFDYYDPAEMLVVKEIKVEGGIAFLSCNYAVNVKVKDNGKEYSNIGKLVNIFKRGNSGKWECIYSIWNSNNHTFDFHSEIPADFSGEWKLNPERSTRIPDLITSGMVINQQGDKINIERSFEIKGKEPLRSVVNCTIGDEIKSKSKPGSQITTSFWGSDKQSFTIIEKMITAGEEYKRTTKYSLTDRGECLKIISFDQIPLGSLDSTGREQVVLTFDKKHGKE